MNWREEILRGLRSHPEVSVLILGGGINGIGLFRELALQGVDALLIDKADFVAGASSKASRMIHGGLRYLETGEVRLVRESLAERNRLLENAPHYVTPLQTTIPLFSWFGGLVKSPLLLLGCPVKPGGRGALLVKLGLWLYDFLTREDRKTAKHFFSGREESLRRHPGLHPKIIATATYWDAHISQAERLCIELIQDAHEAHPDCRAMNYVTLEGIEDGAVRLADPVTRTRVRVRPRVVVNASGAWVDITNGMMGLETRFMGGTKGSHLVVESEELLRALGDRMIYYEHEDGRVCIAFGFMGKVVMGSTDIRVDDPDAARCGEDEIAYMLRTLRGVFPALTIPRDRIVFTFCGVRPLPAARDDVTATISRGHRIEVIEPGAGRPFPVFSMIGGKWTTFRAFAEQTADRILPRLGLPRRGSTAHVPIGGGRDYPTGRKRRDRWIERVAAVSGLDPRRVAVLLARYGTRAEAYASRATGDDEHPLETLPGYTVGEIRTIAASEYVVHLADLVCRRSTIAILGEASRAVLEELADILAGPLGWDAARRDEEVRRAREDVAV